MAANKKTYKNISTQWTHNKHVPEMQVNAYNFSKRFAYLYESFANRKNSLIYYADMVELGK